MSPCSRRARSAPAMSAATPPSSAPTTCCPATLPFYEWSMKLWEGLEQDLNYNAMVSQRGVLNLYHSDAAARRLCAARQRHAAARRRCRAARPRRRCASMLPFLDFDNARFPIHGGLLQRRGGTVRHDAVAWGYARARRSRGVDIIQNCEVTGFRDRERRASSASRPRAASSAPNKVGARRRRQLVARRRDGGPAAADREPRAAGLRLRGHQAADRRRHDLRRRAFLRQPVRQGRAGLRRRHRRLQFLCPARQPAGRSRMCAKAAWR